MDVHLEIPVAADISLSDETFNRCPVYRYFTQNILKTRWFCWKKSRVLYSSSSLVRLSPSPLFHGHMGREAWGILSNQPTTSIFVIELLVLNIQLITCEQHHCTCQFPWIARYRRHIVKVKAIILSHTYWTTYFSSLSWNVHVIFRTGYG